MAEFRDYYFETIKTKLRCGHVRELPISSLSPLKSTGKPLRKIYCEYCGGNYDYSIIWEPRTDPLRLHRFLEYGIFPLH